MSPGRRLRVLAALAGAALFVACGREPRPGLAPRHLVLITVGALRADHLSCYGYRRATSALPSTDAQREMHRAMGFDDLARAGVVFANAYSPSGSTVASLATLLTGRSPLETGVVDDAACLPADVPSLPELCARAGFDTAAFVTVRHADVARALGRGFARLESGADDRETLQAATRWLERDFGDGRQVLLWVHLDGLEPTWARRGAGELGPLTDSRRFSAPDYTGPVDGSAQVFEKLSRGELPLEPADRARTIDLYDGEIASTLGALSTFLRRAFDFQLPGGAEVSEFWARTVLVMTSPHGIELFERGRLGHAGGMHDEVLRVPLLLRHPDSLTGERISSEPVELADVLPTLLDWFELPVPAGVDGRSLLDRLDARPRAAFESRAAIAAEPGRMYSLRTRRWRLVWNAAGAARETAPGLPGPRETRLYDHRFDAGEQHDLSALHPGIVRELELRIARWVLERESRPRADCAEPGTARALPAR